MKENDSGPQKVPEPTEKGSGEISACEAKDQNELKIWIRRGDTPNPNPDAHISCKAFKHHLR